MPACRRLASPNTNVGAAKRTAGNIHPALRDQIDVHHVPHARPRPALIALLGEPRQNCPTLVVGSASPAVTALVTRSSVTHRDYCTGVDAITAYLVAMYGVSAPHP